MPSPFCEQSIEEWTIPAVLEAGACAVRIDPATYAAEVRMAMQSPRARRLAVQILALR